MKSVLELVPDKYRSRQCKAFDVGLSLGDRLLHSLRLAEVAVDLRLSVGTMDKSHGDPEVFFFQFDASEKTETEVKEEIVVDGSARGRGSMGPKRPTTPPSRLRSRSPSRPRGRWSSACLYWQ